MPYLSTCLNSVISKTNIIISALHMYRIPQITLKSVVSYSMSWELLSHGTRATISALPLCGYPSGQSTSHQECRLHAVSRIVSGSFPPVIASLVAIITNFSLVNSTRVNKSRRKSPCKQ